MRYVPAFIVDAVLVTVFALLGRLSHGEDAAGVLLTAWPFLVALAVGHLLAALLPGRPRKPWGLGWGVVAWIVTLAGGMGLRLVSGDTAEAPFVIVATLMLLVLLVGWRAIAAILRGRRSRTAVVATGALPADAVADAAAPVPTRTHASAPEPAAEPAHDETSAPYDIDTAPAGDPDAAAEPGDGASDDLPPTSA